VGVCVRVTSSVGEGVIDSPGVGVGEFVGVGESVGVMVKMPGVGSGEGGDSNSPSRAAVEPANRIMLKSTARASAALRSRSKVAPPYVSRARGHPYRIAAAVEHLSVAATSRSATLIRA
jgi:hypothetical protein